MDRFQALASFAIHPDFAILSVHARCRGAFKDRLPQLLGLGLVDTSVSATHFNSMPPVVSAATQTARALGQCTGFWS
jgi:hypothetical protein